MTCSSRKMPSWQETSPSSTMNFLEVATQFMFSGSHLNNHLVLLEAGLIF